MKLDHEFIQLPFLFDANKLADEVNGIDKRLWQAHHEGFKGNFSIPLISVDGANNNDFKGAMGTTAVLEACPYLKTVISSFGEVIGRSRLMGLAPGAQVPVHSDINYHWYKRVRIHIPIVTHEEVQFYCGEKQIHMESGHTWIFDSWKYHRVENNSDVFRVHLVIDICGSSRFWNMVKKGNVPGLPLNTPVNEFTYINQLSQADIATEQFNVPLVMSPGEMEGLAVELFNELFSAQGNNADDLDAFVDIVKQFCQDWRVLWCQYGLREAGWKHYHALRDAAYQQVKQYDSSLMLANGTQAPRMFLFCMIEPALNVEVKDSVLGLDEKPALDEHKPDASARVPGRNEPCPCGSNKRYKNCHGRL